MTKEEKLAELLDGKYGFLEKVELHTNSYVPNGYTVKGEFAIRNNGDDFWVTCFGIQDGVKTSPIQSIENVTYGDDDTIVEFKTMTSTYRAIIANEELTEDE